ncbi:3-oxoacyl-ACP synthase III [Myxococcota bacterium]|nr:3-oxoacyl-ACP synthase III [Myxococcota bacterium]MBU1433223.1 3-oxoacyl-ACP synthase III [Myxococcota bacterium]MBU1900633.1 3-oxoacyl-ACP synthase III [Myxococcota bacterium]
MRFQHVEIGGVYAHLPQAIIKTAALEAMLRPMYARISASVGVLEAMTGVRARRFWPEGVMPSQAAIGAAEGLLAQTGFDRRRLGALISTAVSKDFLEPAIAAVVHGALGLDTTCLNFDVGNACLGFLSGMSLAASLIEGGAIEAALVVAGESSRGVAMATARRLLAPGVTFRDYADNLATLTLGSAGVAMLLTRRGLSPQGHALIGAEARAATQFADLCVGSEAGMKTDAPKLLAEGVRLARQAWQAARDHLEIDPARVALYAMHQVGVANHDAVIQALDLDEACAPRLYPDYGNVGAAGVPLTLALSQGALQPGDEALLMGIGSGLNVQIMKVIW